MKNKTTTPVEKFQTLIVKSIPQTRTYTSLLTFLVWYKHYNNIYNEVAELN